MVSELPTFAQMNLERDIAAAIERGLLIGSPVEEIKKGAALCPCRSQSTFLFRLVMLIEDRRDGRRHLQPPLMQR